MRRTVAQAAGALIAGALFAACGGARHAARAELEAAHAEPEIVGRTHVVAKGETLRSIARAYGVSAEEIAKLNGIADPARIAPGQILLLPDAAQESQAVGAVAETKARLAWPLVGVLYARYGKRGETVHEGLDLAAPEGTPVKAAADGKVLFAGEQRGYGHIVILEHVDGIITLYAHAGEVLVEEGAAVKAGDAIAKVGPASGTSGPHLHFEVREGRTPRDPLKYLPEPM